MRRSLNLGNHAQRRLSGHSLGRLSPGLSDRQQVSLRFGFQIVDSHDEQARRIGTLSERNRIDHLHGTDQMGFAPEPPLSWQNTRQRSLEFAFGSATHDFLPVSMQDEFRGLIIGR